MIDIEDTVPLGTTMRIKKPVRSWSGVLVVTIVMKPDKFSCPFNCHYCPNETIANGAETDQPRSYLSTEPAVMRANQNDFDCARQVWDRLGCLRKNGHTIDKIEIIVLGGTFSSYPRSYQYEFMRDIYFAANEFTGNSMRSRLSIEEEQSINETTRYRIIGVSLETRPDQINVAELVRFRLYGCTRVQIGVQHTDDDILEYINRGHTVQRSIDAIALLKNFGFKVDIHVMPDLPGSNPDLDKQMLERVITSPEFSPDYMKIYPCLDVKFTEIRKWKLMGKWKPYAESSYHELVDVIVHAKKVSKEWIRFNRIQRDFPPEIEGRVGYISDTIKPNLREYITKECKVQGVSCKCIRCKEIKNGKMVYPITYNLETYNASEGIEHYISATSPDRSKLYGFVRLRINGNSKVRSTFAPLPNVALVRELHVYGKILSVSDRQRMLAQHIGIGKQLMSFAETLASTYYCSKISVISGVGVREYYKKLGYVFVDDDMKYMTKKIAISMLTYIHMRYCLQGKSFFVDISLMVSAFVSFVVLGYLAVATPLVF